MPRLQPRPVIENDFLTAALSYLDSGYVIMPIWGVRNGECSCHKGNLCDRPAKHPISVRKDGRWTWDRVTNKSRAERIWGVQNPPNIAICTGPQSGIWVLDVDDDGEIKFGWQSLEQLEWSIGELPDSRLVTTGSGGGHYYFLWPETQEITNSNRNLPEDLDVRGKGGFVLAPPSVTLKGEYFCVDDDPVLSAQPELLEMLKPPVHVREGAVNGATAGTRDPAALDRYAEAALDREIDRLRALQGAKSGWNNGVFQSACNMLEIANAPWCSFTEREVLSMIRKNSPTPTDGKPWSPEPQIEGAMRYIGTKFRPEPA